VIRDATREDAARVCEIYNHYVAGSIVTFEQEPVTVSDMRGRIATSGAEHPWLVVERDIDGVVGFAFASPWKSRCAYRHSVETSVYLAPDAVGRGLGSELYDRLLARLDEGGCRSAIGGIALPSPASVALHEKLGFVKVAHFREVGFKFGAWIDVGYWQKLFTGKQPEDRSPDAGGDAGAPE